MGLASYYRRFIQGLSPIAAPLMQLTKKEEHFVWSFACEHNFETLKDRFTLALIPSLPGCHENFVVYNNASGIGLGYVLMRGRVIPYAP